MKDTMLQTVHINNQFNVETAYNAPHQIPERELPAVDHSAFICQFLQNPGVVLVRDARFDHVAQVSQHRHKGKLLVVCTGISNTK